MQSKEENALDNQYIFRHGSGSFSDVITYRKCLIDEIKKGANTMENHDIQNFSSKSVTDDKLEAFTEIAEARDIPFTRFKSCKKPWKRICRGAVQSSPRQILHIVR